MKLLLTGPPGVGKTTLVKRIVVKLRGTFSCSGFVTEEVRGPDGDRVGFDIVTLDGRVASLSRKARTGGPRVGDYRVDLPSLETVGVPAMTQRGADLVVVDEIGLMEIASPLFREELLRLLDGDGHMLATIRRVREPFCDAVKARPDVEMVEVDQRNRDALVEMLAVRLIDAVIPQ